MLGFGLRAYTQQSVRTIRHRTWAALVQPSCAASQRFQSSLTPAKPFYITTPIFYVNAAPHVGHLYTLVLTDILKRWQVLNGRQAILCTGTDEHGMKIQRAAEAVEMDTKVFCDQNAAMFQDLAERVNLSNDHFIRTTDPEHKVAVQHFWMLLQERGYIYESKHEGWYSVSDETFYPESAVQRSMNQSTGKTFIASIETGKEVEWTSEVNYHFRLSAFRDRLLEFYKENPTFIVPHARMQQVVKSVEEGLSDLSISRPVSRLTWGVPVPGDATQTIYVWLDALINYLTTTGFPFQAPGETNVWPADVQVIGKDIVRFHCIYWPAFLMALDMPPAKRVLTHAHWTLGRRKMAKSTGNVVNPFFAIDRFGLDAIRFYMSYDGGIQHDSDYDNAYITDRYKKCLYGSLGGLASRILRSPSWNVKETVRYMTTKDSQAQNSDRLDPESVKLTDMHRRLITNLPERVTRHYENLDSGAATREIMDAVFATNAYLQLTEPWKYSREESGKVAQIIYLCAESLRVCGILLQPVMPTKMGEMLSSLGVKPEQRMFKDTMFGNDKDYGSTIQGGPVKERRLPRPLFPPINVDWTGRQKLPPQLRILDKL